VRIRSVAFFAFVNQIGTGGEQTYVSWVFRPVVYAGFILVANAVCGALWLTLRTGFVTGPGARAITTLGIAVVVAGLGTGFSYQRDHPRSALLDAVRHLAPPKGVTMDRTTFGSNGGYAGWPAEGDVATVGHAHYAVFVVSAPGALP